MKFRESSSNSGTQECMPKTRAVGMCVSGALVFENLRRFWAVPVIGFLIYFLSGVFPILMSYSQINKMASYIERSFDNQQFFYMTAHLLLPIITAIIVFRYLQSVSAVAAFHAMPFTRMQLYLSNLLSGLLMILLPLLANGLVLLCIAKPAYYPWAVLKDGSFADTAEEVVNVFARSDILNWMWESILIVLVIYSISVFAGIVTGNSVMHLVTAMGFNFLFPALFLVVMTYCGNYLYGFPVSGAWNELFLSISPYTEVLNHGGEFPRYLQFVYLIVAAGFFVLSAALYKRRKLEKATDSLVFRFMAPVISYLIAFFGMSLLGFYFDSLGESDAYMYAGLIAGAVIFFILGRMIVLKTHRIFNSRSLKNFLIFAVLAALFVTSITFDLTGYEDRTADGSRVRSADASIFFADDTWNRFDAALFKGAPEEFWRGFCYQEPESVEAFIRLHRDIIANKEAFMAAQESDSGVRTFFINLAYDIGNPLEMERSYSVPEEFLMKSSDYKLLFESKEFKEYFAWSNLEYQYIAQITLQNPLLSGISAVSITKQSDIAGFLDAMDRDFTERTFEEQVNPIHAYAGGTMEYRSGKEARLSERSAFEMQVKQSDTHTIAWLNEHGYGAALDIDADMVDSITVYKYQYDNEPYAADERYYKDTQLEEERKAAVTDKAQIQILLDTYEAREKSYNCYYYAEVTFRPAAISNDAEDGYYYDGKGYRGYQQMYFSEDSIPAFVSSRFSEL